MLSRLHHVAFVVSSVDSAMEFIEKSFGLKAQSRTRFESDGVDLAIFRLGDTFFEVTAPIGQDSPLARFLEEKGPGIHHVAFGSEDLQSAVLEMANRGVNAGDGKPRTGRSGWTVVNVDSREALGIAVQLVQQ